MKKISLFTSFALLACSALPCLASPIVEPLLRYEFDKSGAVQTSTGSRSLDLTIKNYAGANTDYIGSAPVQRAGATNANALDFTYNSVDASLAAGDQVKGTARTALNDTNALFLREGLGSFTISAWVLDVAPSGDGVNGARRLFTLRGTSVVLDFYLSKNGAVNELTFVTEGSEGKVTSKAAASLSIPMASEEWHFISVSYNAETGELNFYTGAEGGSLSTSNASNVIGGEVNTLLSNATELTIGNARYQDQRRLHGYISDFRFYGSELTAEDINSIYAIPEPGTALILGAGVLVVWWRGCARRKQ